MINLSSKLVLIPAILGLISACHKRETMEVDNLTQTAFDYSLADQEMMALVPAVYVHMCATKGTGAEVFPGNSCAPFEFVSGDTIGFSPDPVYTLELSKTSCSLPDGKVRSGKIYLRLTDKYANSGSLSILKFENYCADGVNYRCDSMVIKRLQSNSASVQFDIQLSNGTCSVTNYSIEYKCSKTMSVFPVGDASATGPLTYNVGTSEGTNRQGLPFKAKINWNIVKHNNCRYFEKGGVEIYPEGITGSVFDFGEGTCDDEATYEVNQKTVSFKLK